MGTTPAREQYFKEMRVKSYFLTTCVVAILCGMYTASCSSLRRADKDPVQSLKTEVRKIVEDIARADAMLASIDQMTALAGQLRTTAKRQRAEIDKQLRDYGTTRVQIEAILDANGKERQKIADQLVNAHYNFKAKATQKEWKSLAKMEKAALADAAKKRGV